MRRARPVAQAFRPASEGPVAQAFRPASEGPVAQASRPASEGPVAQAFRPASERAVAQGVQPCHRGIAMPSFPVELRLNNDLGIESKAPNTTGPAVTGDTLPEPEFPMYPRYLTP